MLEVGDEPHSPENGTPWQQVEQRMANSANASTEIRRFITTIPDFLVGRGLLGEVEIVAPNVVQVDSPGLGNLLPEMRRVFLTADRRELWTYQSCSSHGCGYSGRDPSLSWPDLAVDALGLQMRAEPWMSFMYGVSCSVVQGKPCVSGVFYYEAAKWAGIPLDSRGADSIFGDVVISDGDGHGDGLLVYPGTEGHTGEKMEFPIPSLRLKLIRDALEDYEWLIRCQQKKGEEAFRIAKSLFAVSGLVEGSMYRVMRGSSQRARVEELRDARLALYRCVTGEELPSAVLVEEVSF